MASTIMPANNAVSVNDAAIWDKEGVKERKKKGKGSQMTVRLKYQRLKGGDKGISLTMADLLSTNFGQKHEA